MAGFGSRLKDAVPAEYASRSSHVPPQINPPARVGYHSGRGVFCDGGELWTDVLVWKTGRGCYLFQPGRTGGRR